MWVLILGPIHFSKRSEVAKWQVILGATRYCHKFAKYAMRTHRNSKNHTNSYYAVKRRWVFTWNNPDTILTEDHFRSWKHARYLVYQEEIGQSGTHHLQGYAEFNKAVKTSNMKILKDNGAHFEGAMGTPQQCKSYCTKEDTRVGGPYEYGETSGGQGTRTEISYTRDMIKAGATKKDLAEDNTSLNTMVKYNKGINELFHLYEPKPDRSNIHVTFHYGPAGTGKTHCANKPGAHWFDGHNGFWNGYERETTIILDEFGGHTMTPKDLQRLCDKYDYTCNTKGDYKPCYGTDIHICSNYLPFQWWGEKTKYNKAAIYRRIHEAHYHDRLGHYKTWHSDPLNINLTPEEQMGGHAISKMEAHLWEIHAHPEKDIVLDVNE